MRSIRFLVICQSVSFSEYLYHISSLVLDTDDDVAFLVFSDLVGAEIILHVRALIFLHILLYNNILLLLLLLLLLLFFLLGLQDVRHAQIMRRCGLEQVCCSNPVPTSESGKSRPRLWVPNPYSLSPTRRSNMRANDKGQMNGYIGNDKRE